MIALWACRPQTSEWILSPKAWETYCTRSLGISFHISLALAHVEQEVGSDFISNLSPSIVFCSTSCLIATGEMWPIFLCNLSTVCILTLIYVLIFAIPSSSTQYRPWCWGILPIWVSFGSLIQQVLSLSKIMKLAVSHLASETKVYPDSRQYNTSFNVMDVLSLPLGTFIFMHPTPVAKKIV